MKVSAQIFGESCSGKVFCFSSGLSVAEDSSLNVACIKRKFEQRYATLLSRFENMVSEQPTIGDFTQAYLDVLKDSSFKSQIIHYIDKGYSRSTALMNFFENDILGVLSERISNEIFGLIRLLSDDTDRPYAIPSNAMLVTQTLSFADILKIELDKIAGVVLTNSTLNSHDVQILVQLSIPVALSDPSIDLFNKLLFKPPHVLSFYSDHLTIQRVDHDYQTALLS